MQVESQATSKGQRVETQEQKGSTSRSQPQLDPGNHPSLHTHGTASRGCSRMTAGGCHCVPIAQARQGETSDNTLKCGLKILPSSEPKCLEPEEGRMEPGC